MIPKVSIVVPIYKVEKFLNRCIDSILNQTYKNLEIILVDDGSPDNCGKIANSYSLKDSRVRVFHKINGGLSDARNYGMKYVTGEYTLFVDSDDWLEEQMIEVMINTIIRHKAEIVQTAFYYAYDKYLLFDERYHQVNSPPVVLNNETIMSELVINERVKNFAWGKLYRTDIIRDVTFKKGVLFEDVFWAHHIMKRVNTYVILNQPMYYYYQRSDSIISNYSPRNLDIIEGLKERHVFIERYYKHLIDESHRQIAKACLIHFNLLLVNMKKDKNCIYKKGIQQYVNKNYSKFMMSVKYDSDLRKQLYLFNIFPVLNIVIPLKNKLLRRLKIVSQPLGLRRIDL
jgi:glycosyltransferase involved in cell wall biosynthesis